VRRWPSCRSRRMAPQIETTLLDLFFASASA
jgi:hypothetical protein